MAHKSPPPQGEASASSFSGQKFVVRRSFFELLLTTYLTVYHGLTLGSPRGGTNSDRVLRTKQGAVSGAALWFLQAHVMRAAKIS